MLLIKSLLSNSESQIMSKICSKLYSESYYVQKLLGQNVISHVSVWVLFACLFPCVFQLQNLKFRNSIFKIFNIRFVPKGILVHGRIFNKLEPVCSLWTESSILFSFSTPCLLSESLIKKKKKKSVLSTLEVCLSGKQLTSQILTSANVGNCFCDIHIFSHFDTVHISVEICTYGNISFIKSFKTFYCGYLAFKFANSERHFQNTHYIEGSEIAPFISLVYSHCAIFTFCLLITPNHRAKYFSCVTIFILNSSEDTLLMICPICTIANAFSYHFFF